MLFLNFHVQGTCENIFAVFLDFCSLDRDDQVGFSVISCYQGLCQSAELTAL